MLTNGVALVLTKTVARMLGVQPKHQSVTGSFGKNRCGSDRHALAVTLDDGMLGQLQLLQTPRIEQDMLWCEGEAFDRATHGKLTGPVDVDAVDLLHLGESHTPRQGRLLYLGGKSISACGIELLGIVNSRQPRSRRKDDGRRRYRAGDRKSTRLNSSHLGISYA